MMRCDNCGGKHKRIPVERPWYSARFCDKCSIRHSAKEVGRPLVKSAYGKLLFPTAKGLGGYRNGLYLSVSQSVRNTFLSAQYLLNP